MPTYKYRVATFFRTTMLTNILASLPKPAYLGMPETIVTSVPNSAYSPYHGKQMRGKKKPTPINTFPGKEESGSLNPSRSSSILSYVSWPDFLAGDASQKCGSTESLSTTAH